MRVTQTTLKNMSAKCIVLVVLVQLVLNLLVQNSTSFIYSRQNKRSLGLIMRETYTLKRISNFNREFLLMIRTRPQTPMYYIKESSEFTVNEIDLSVPKKKERFSRTADSKQELEEPCILTIENVRYNLTAWGKSAFVSFSHMLSLVLADFVNQMSI